MKLTPEERDLLLRGLQALNTRLETTLSKTPKDSTQAAQLRARIDRVGVLFERLVTEEPA